MRFDIKLKNFQNVRIFEKSQYVNRLMKWGNLISCFGHAVTLSHKNIHVRSNFPEIVGKKIIRKIDKEMNVEVSNLVQRLNRSPLLTKP